jgi:hypothetical protein
MGTSWSPSVTVTPRSCGISAGLDQPTALAPLVVYGLFTMPGVLMISGCLLPRCGMCVDFGVRDALLVAYRVCWCDGSAPDELSEL